MQLYQIFTDSSHFRNLYVIFSGVEVSNKMSLYTVGHKMFVIKTSYSFGGSCVAVDRQFCWEFSVHVTLSRETIHLSINLSIYDSAVLLLYLGHFLSFLILYTVSRTLWMGDQPITRLLPTHRTTQTQNKCRQTYMPWMGLEPTIPAFEWAKTVHASERAAAVIGRDTICWTVNRFEETGSVSWMSEGK
jgi:hypothetical protein